MMLTINTFYCVIGEVTNLASGVEGKVARLGNLVSGEMRSVNPLCQFSVVRKNGQPAISGQKLSEAEFTGFIGFAGLGNVR